MPPYSILITPPTTKIVKIYEILLLADFGILKSQKSYFRVLGFLLILMITFKARLASLQPIFIFPEYLNILIDYFKATI